jgi:uncharacterized protein (UPF0333 family)
VAIQSAFNAGIQGFQQAQQSSNNAAQNIVESTAYSAEDFRYNQQLADNADNVNNSNNIDSTTSRAAAPDLNQSLIDLKVAEYQAKASAQVIKTADDALGNLLDVSV